MWGAPHSGGCRCVAALGGWAAGGFLPISRSRLARIRREADSLGIPATPEDVINSSLVLARHLHGLDPGAPVFVIGEPPMLAEMRAHGFEVRDDERVRWVVIAFDRTFSYAKLNTALQAVRRGARLIATNPDRTCPVEGGEIPDCAGMIAAVEAVTDTKVEAIVGSRRRSSRVALASLGCPAETVMVGDRIDTDIAMGRRSGLHTILVLRSASTRANDLANRTEPPADHVLGSSRSGLKR